DAVMRGRDLTFQPGKANWLSAKRNFEGAIAFDSSYAPAWAWLSAVCRVGVDREDLPRDAGYRQGREAGARALTVDPNLPEAWVQLGQTQRLVDWDWTAAEQSFQRAAELDPGNSDVIYHLATIKAALGHLDEAIALDRRTVELDPLDPLPFLSLSG